MIQNLDKEKVKYAYERYLRAEEKLRAETIKLAVIVETHKADIVPKKVATEVKKLAKKYVDDFQREQKVYAERFNITESARAAKREKQKARQAVQNSLSRK